jgi:hypothetical protein
MLKPFEWPHVAAKGVYDRISSNNEGGFHITEARTFGSQLQLLIDFKYGHSP